MKIKQIISCLIIYAFLVVTGCQSQSSEKEAPKSGNFQTVESSKPENDPPKHADRLFIENGYDTIVQGNYKLLFEPLNNVSFASYTPELNDKPIKEYDNSHQQAMALERYLAEKYSNYFTANDSLLTVYLDSGDSIAFPKWEGEYGFTFENYFPESNYLLLYVQYIEGNGWLLVNRKNGYLKHIEGRPFFSPDGKRVLTASVDLEAGYNFNGMEYYLSQGDTLVKCFTLETKDWGPQSIKWASNSSADIEKSFWTFQNNEIVYQTAFARMFIDER
jgi:hypothetical protein